MSGSGLGRSRLVLRAFTTREEEKKKQLTAFICHTSIVGYQLHLKIGTENKSESKENIIRARTHNEYDSVSKQ